MLTSILLVVLVSVQAIHAADRPTVDLNVAIDKAGSEGFPRVFGYSGNIWLVPRVFDFGVADMVLEMPQLGIARIGLGDEILSHASSMKDLEKRLENFRLNDFLKRYRKAGGRVMIILDSVPFWASSNQTRLKKGHLEKFRLSPPADYQEWSRIVATIVRHFNLELGIDAYYEVWNEPDVDFLGDNSQYARLFYHTVVGAKKADSKAMVGGPGVSDFTAKKTGGEKKQSGTLQEPLMFEWLLDYASRTPVPELGLRRLPVDFISWHAYYLDPTIDYAVMVPYLRHLLESKGYPRSTPLLDSEWNIAPVPPYAEGDLNASEVGAAYVASTLIAMHEAGVDGQVFQMFVDPGVEGYSGGTFTTAGVPRANFNTFRLFSKLRGRQLKSSSSDDWVRSVAYTDGQRVYLLVATMMPTPMMLANGLGLRRRIEADKIFREAPNSVTRQDVAAFMKNGKSLPAPLQNKLSSILERDKNTIDQYKEKVASWNNGISLNISLSGASGRPGKISRYLIDSDFSNGHDDIQQAIKEVVEKNKSMLRQAKSRLEKLGIGEPGQKAFFNDIRTNASIGQTLARLPENKRTQVKAVFQQMVDEYRGNIQQVMDRKKAQLHKEDLSWPDSGILAVPSEPYSVQLFVIDK
jgi:phage terminase Nu1 subunit (DNA packaging protein)